MPSATSHAVSVRRWRSVHLVAADQPAAERVQERLDDALRTDFDRAAADALDRAFGTDQGLVFVKRLEIDAAVNASWDRDRIAGAWSRAFARELLDEIASGSSENVVRFSKRASWLASYIVARATGGTGAWFHRDLEGWSMLPASVAIRSALCDDREAGLDALGELPSGTRARVVSALTEADAGAIVRGLAAVQEPSIERLASLLLAAVPEADHLTTLDAPRLAVWFLGVCADASQDDVVAASRLLAAVPERLTRNPGLRAGPLIASLCGAHDVLARCVSASQRGRPADLHAALRAAVAEPGVQGAADRVERYTPHGGAFLLLDDLPETDAITRVLILGRCLRDDEQLLFDDDGCRELCGLAPMLDHETVEAWSDAHADLIERGARKTLARFAGRLPGFADSSASYLRANFLACSAHLAFEPERIVVTLSRPPLDLILNLSGRNRGERRWPWLDARPFVLFPGD